MFEWRSWQDWLIKTNVIDKSTGLRYQGGTRYVWQNITGQLRCSRCVPQRWQTEREREVLPLSQWQGKNIDSVLREEGQEECMMERETVVTSERVMTTCAAHTWFMPRISPPEHCHNMLNTHTHTPVEWWLHSQETFVCLCLGSILIFHVPPSLKLQATAGSRYEQYEPVVTENSF